MKIRWIIASTHRCGLHKRREIQDKHGVKLPVLTRIEHLQGVELKEDEFVMVSERDVPFEQEFLARVKMRTR